MGSPTVSPPLSASYRRLAGLLLLVGLGCRATLYLLNHPLYMDEAFLGVNLLDRDFLGLTRQLHEFQVAPVLFLWAERAGPPPTPRTRRGAPAPSDHARLA